MQTQVNEVQMNKANLCGLLALIVTFLSLKSFSQTSSPSLAFQQSPVQYLMIHGTFIDSDVQVVIPEIHEALRLTNISLNHSMLSAKQQGDLAALTVIYAKIPKLKKILLNFWTFYNGSYHNFEAEDKLTPQELVNLIERLKWFETYFNFLKKRKFLTKMLKPFEIEDLEIVELKNIALKETLSLEVRRIHQAHQADPEKMKVLFKDIDLDKLSSRAKSVQELNHAFSRLATLESSQKLCIGLF